VAKLAPLATATLGFSRSAPTSTPRGARPRCRIACRVLARPADEFVLPRSLAVVAVIAVGVAIALPEPIDQFAWVFAGPLAAAYALQGFAVLHALSRAAAASAADRRALFLLRRSRRMDAALIALRRAGRQRGELARARRGGAALEDLSFAITLNLRRERWK